MSFILFDCYKSRIKNNVIFLSDELFNILFFSALDFIQFQLLQTFAHPASSVSFHARLEVLVLMRIIALLRREMLSALFAFEICGGFQAL